MNGNKTYVIKVGTECERYNASELHGKRWELFRTSAAVTYTEDDIFLLFAQDKGIVFNLPKEAKPYTRLYVGHIRND